MSELLRIGTTFVLKLFHNMLLFFLLDTPLDMIIYDVEPNSDISQYLCKTDRGEGSHNINIIRVLTSYYLKV